MDSSFFLTQNKKQEKESLEDAKKKKAAKQAKNFQRSTDGSSKKGKSGGGSGGGGGGSGSGGGSDGTPQDAFTKILLKVGIIEEIKEHPNADTLYIETINLGEEKGSRQIVSGLKAHYPDMESLKGRKVVVSDKIILE